MLSMSDSSSFVSDGSCSDGVKHTRAIRRRNRKNSKDDRKLSAQKLFNEISRTIAGATKHQLLSYEGIDPKTGSLVVDSLDQDGRVEKMGHR